MGNPVKDDDHADESGLALGDELQCTVAVDRARAVVRAFFWTVPALVFGAFTFPIYTNLDFATTAVSNGAVQAALALLASPLPIVAVICAFQAGRWFLLAAWPGPLGVFTDRQRLVLKLGSFGQREYAANALDIRYPFELLDEGAEEVTFEAYLPEDEQIEKFVPRIVHRTAHEPVGRTILRFGKGTEADIAARLRPFIVVWRSRNLAES